MIRNRLLGLGATLLLLGVLIGLPLTLLAVGANPLPSSLPSLERVRAALTSPDDGTLMLAGITVIAWVAWAVLAVSILLELLGRLRGLRAPHLPGLSLPQGAARQLVTAAALLFVVGSTGATASGAAQAVSATAGPVTATVSASAPVAAAKAAAPAHGTSAGESEQRHYTVRDGDSLSAVAKSKLGDADRWPEIFEASRSTRQPGGVYLVDPNQIDVGWSLTLPPVAAAKATAPVHGPDTAGEVSQPSPPLDPPTHTRPVPQTDPRPAPPVPPPAPTAAADAPPPRATRAPPAAADTDEEAPSTPGWVLAGLSGSGVLLAGSMLLLLRRRRRAQFRHRRPGHTMARPEPLLAPVEKTVVTVGASTAPTVEFMDGALRRLAAQCADSEQSLPVVAAVELTDSAVVLHLGAPANLGEPWSGTPDGYHWRLDGHTALDLVGPDVPDQPAPYPLLVTVGLGDDGELWLLNVEDLNVSITGDPTYGQDFARYLAAEIACNPWSAGVDVACVGVAGELAPLNPDRIHAYDPAETSSDPIAEMLADAVHTVDRARDAGTDAATARAHQAGADAWPARLLLVDAVNDNPVVDQLVDVVNAHAGYTATSVVLRGHRTGVTGTVVDVSAGGRLALPAAGLNLVAVGLTSDEAQGCAALLAASENVDEVPVPVDESAAEGWQSLADEAGALRTEHVLPRARPEGPHEPAPSLLEGDDETYLAAAATTSQDLQTLAPRVAERTRAQVEDADPTLDHDVAMWLHEDCALPRLYLLGPVHATTRGKPLTKRKPYHTELLAFIALRRRGATSAEVADTFGITKPKARDYVNVVRDWLGTNPRTGEPHLPDARLAPAAAVRDMPVYQVLDLLIDADLFRRLRVRGEARGGEAGIEDLKRALSLVDGRPFDYPLERKAGSGWSWLLEGDRLDEQLTVAIVDVAHIVTTHAIAAGDLDAARMAAETAALAAPHEEIPRLDVAAVAAAEGNTAEAQRIVRDEVCNRTDDEGAPPELGERTTQILAERKDWHKHQAS